MHLKVYLIPLCFLLEIFVSKRKIMMNTVQCKLQGEFRVR